MARISVYRTWYPGTVPGTYQNSVAIYFSFIITGGLMIQGFD